MSTEPEVVAWLWRGKHHGNVQSFVLKPPPGMLADPQCSPLILQSAHLEATRALRERIAELEKVLGEVREIVDLQREPHWAYRNTVTGKRQAIRDLIDAAMTPKQEAP